jgi:hypothetical protein
MRKGDSLQDRQQEMKEKWDNTKRKRRTKAELLVLRQSSVINNPLKFNFITEQIKDQSVKF